MAEGARSLFFGNIAKNASLFLILVLFEPDSFIGKMDSQMNSFFRFFILNVLNYIERKETFMKM